ncbi:MAG: hypothetical protein AB7G93_20690 [Bdellovibrionales bacterium]
MKDQLREIVGRWSLDRVQFLLSHIEDFIDDDFKELRQRARAFVPATGLDKIERLVENGPADPELPVRVLDRLSAFFDAGLLVQRGSSEDSGNWWITDLFWRGHVFHLELSDQIRANGLIPEMTPLQVRRAPADKILSSVKMEPLMGASDGDGYLLKPTPTVSYVLLSRMPAPWAMDHMSAAHKLVNKCFLY